MKNPTNHRVQIVQLQYTDGAKVVEPKGSGFHKSTSKSCYSNERPTGQKHNILAGTTVENKGKLILQRYMSVHMISCIFLYLCFVIDPPFLGL